MHKLRRAMVRPGRDRLSGRVEVDETFIGGAEEGVSGRQTERKTLVVIAAQEDRPGIGQIRMHRYPPRGQWPRSTWTIIWTSSLFASTAADPHVGHT
jgi:hypothetical protein